MERTFERYQPSFTKRRKEEEERVKTKGFEIVCSIFMVYLSLLNEKWLLSDIYSEKVTFVQTYQSGPCMEKEGKVDQNQI